MKSESVPVGRRIFFVSGLAFATTSCVSHFDISTIRYLCADDNRSDNSALCNVVERNVSFASLANFVGFFIGSIIGYPVVRLNENDRYDNISAVESSFFPEMARGQYPKEILERNISVDATTSVAMAQDLSSFERRVTAPTRSLSEERQRQDLVLIAKPVFQQNVDTMTKSQSIYDANESEKIVALTEKSKKLMDLKREQDDRNIAALNYIKNFY